MRRFRVAQSRTGRSGRRKRSAGIDGRFAMAAAPDREHIRTLIYEIMIERKGGDIHLDDAPHFRAQAVGKQRLTIMTVRIKQRQFVAP